MDDYRPIETAPRDGSIIEVTSDGEGYFMRWNPAGWNDLVSLKPGIWECPELGFTWSEDRGFGPTHWRPIKTRAV